jgi:hypothetical protein
MEGYHVLDHPWEEREGYVLLGRMEGNVPGYLSYSAEEGEVVCVFESAIEAEQFYMHWRARIPGEGWGTVRPGTEELGFEMSDVVRMNFLTTDVDGTLEAWSSQIKDRLARSGCRQASTLLGVAGLYDPDILIEIEATAVA